MLFRDLLILRLLIANESILIDDLRQDDRGAGGHGYDGSLTLLDAAASHLGPDATSQPRSACKSLRASLATITTRRGSQA